MRSRPRIFRDALKFTSVAMVLSVTHSSLASALHIQQHAIVLAYGQESTILICSSALTRSSPMPYPCVQMAPAAEAWKQRSPEAVLNLLGFLCESDLLDKEIGTVRSGRNSKGNTTNTNTTYTSTTTTTIDNHIHNIPLVFHRYQ